MKQTVFNFFKDTTFEQLELFPIHIYDNRVERLKYSIKIHLAFNGWSIFRTEDIKECVNLFKVNHQTVYDIAEQLCPWKKSSS